MSFAPVWWSGFLGSALILGLAGCGAGHPVSGGQPAKGAALRGRVKGGEQPVTGSSLQLYATSTDGDGSRATPLLQHPVVTDNAGGFSITGAYTCPDADTLVYLVATGGNPGLAAGTNNPSLVLMAALGRCGELTASTFISLNEATTVASVFSLAEFTKSSIEVGSTLGDEQVLANDFLLVRELVDLAAGQPPGASLPSGYSSPTRLINTLADAIAPCVNSAGGQSGDGSPCGDLFATVAAAGDPPPTDTVSALLAMAKNPTSNTAAILGLVPAVSPYQPTLSAVPLSLRTYLLADPSASVPDRTHLLGEYLLQEGSGTVATDTSGLGNDGTIVGATWEGSADLNFNQQQYIRLPTALNGANTWQFATYAPPYGFFGYPLAPEVGGGGAFPIHPSLLCGTTEAHTCLFANTLPGYASQLFWAFNSSGTQAQDPLTAGWHVVTLVGGQNGELDRFYYDGTEVTYSLHGSGAFMHPSTGNYQVGGASTYETSWYVGKVAAVWAWSTSLSPAEVQAATTSAQSLMQAKGVDRPYPDAVHTKPLVIGGIDSRTYGDYQDPGGAWIDQLALDDPSYETLDLGIDGATLFDIAAMFDMYYRPQIEANTAPTIVVFWGGVNDFNAYPNTNAGMTAGSLKALVQRAKAAGARVIVAMEISSNRDDHNKAALDALIRANAFAWGADNIADLAEVPQLGADGAFESRTYFVDGVHPTPEAEPFITAVMSDAVNELIGSSATSHHSTAAASFTERAGDRFLDLKGSVVQTVTLPDCIGYSLPRQIANLGANQAVLSPSGGETLTGSTVIAAGETAILVPVPGSFSTAGCSWQRQ